MRLREILSAKGTDVHTITSQATLQQVVQLLVDRNCGSLVVVESGDDHALIGIVTERDIMRASAVGKPLDATPVEEVMTVEVITGKADDSVEGAMGLMTEKRIRHLPVVAENRLAGIISIGDVVKAQYNHLSAENHHLKTYIQS